MTEPAEEQTPLRVADQPSTSVTRLVGRPAEEIWALISDIEFPAAHSREFLGAEWLDGASGPAVGARFLGRNRNEHVGEWHTTSTIVECEAPHRLTWAVGDPELPLAWWGFTLEEGPGGTTVTQTYRIGLGRSGLTAALERMPDREHDIIARRFADQRVDMERNLAALDPTAD